MEQKRHHCSSAIGPCQAFSVDAGTPSFVQVDVGVEIRSLPHGQPTEFVVVEGEEDVEVDVTDAYMYLPPAAGENRWFMNLQSDTLISASEISFILWK